MREKLLLLLSEIEDANRSQNRLHEKLEQSWGRYRATAEYNYLVETAFYLSQLSIGYERVLEAVARAFGDSAGKPAMLSGEALGCMNELRAFRHFFHCACDADLDPKKVEPVVEKAFRLKALWAEGCREFMRDLEKKVRAAGAGLEPG